MISFRFVLQCFISPRKPLRRLNFLISPTKIPGDFPELFDSGFDVFHNFLGENVEISNITPDPVTHHLCKV